MITLLYVDEVGKAWQANVTLQPALTVQAVLDQLPVLSGWPEAICNQVRQLPCGVWGNPALPDQHLLPGDRLEWYRPLIFNPKQRRQQRAAGFVRDNQRRRS